MVLSLVKTAYPGLESSFLIENPAFELNSSDILPYPSSVYDLWLHSIYFGDGRVWKREKSMNEQEGVKMTGQVFRTSSLVSGK